jgi:hypothetical protein
MIALTQPWALLSLASIPIILALFSLRPKRRTVRLPTTALWREALIEQNRGLGLRRLLRDLSLLLLLLAALGLALGLADPRWLTHSAAQEEAVLVLDVSASMKARAAGGTRFAEARREAADLIAAMPEGGRMLIMTSGRHPVLRSGFEADKELLRRTLAEVEPTDEAGRPREALSLALSLLRDRETGRIHFLTDAAFDQDADVGAARIDYRVVGGPVRNVAITRFDLRPELASEDRFQVLLTVRNYDAEPLDVPVSVTLDRERLFRRELHLPPGGRQTLVVPLRGRAVGRARAAIEHEDDLAADNYAFAVLGVDEALRVLLVTEGNFYLESVLQALPNVVLEKLGALSPESLSREARLHDVVVLDRVAAASLPPGSYLLVDTVPPDLPFTATGSVVQPAIAGKGASVLVRQVDLSGVKIDRARRIAITDRPPGLQRLFWSADTELALALLKDDVRVVFLGFDLLRSSFPLQTAFPLFLRESLTWLRPRLARTASTQLAAGESIAIEVPVGRADVVVRTPAGDGLLYEVEDGPLQFDATSQSGIYRYMVADVRRHFAVNLTDEEESDLDARAHLGDQRRTPPQVGSQSRVEIALWPYLVATAMLGLVLEWGLWCARRARA